MISPNVMIRKEKAGRKINNDSDEFEVQNNDIYITSGPHLGKSVSIMWQSTAEERDYVMDKIYSLGDSAVNKIIHKMCCR